VDTAFTLSGTHIMPVFDAALRHDLPFVAVVGNDSRWNAEYHTMAR
jgi:acetolactate synthase-1/2/3 large subunit